jgi:hypothetical protein
MIFMAHSIAINGHLMVLMSFVVTDNHRQRHDFRFFRQNDCHYSVMGIVVLVLGAIFPSDVGDRA